MVHNTLSSTTGYLVIQEDCRLYGTLDVNVTVVGPAVVSVDGTLTHHLTVMPGATVLLHGNAHQTITNRGGTLYIYGKVYGTLELKGGKTVIDGAAVVARITPIPSRIEYYKQQASPVSIS